MGSDAFYTIKLVSYDIILRKSDAIRAFVRVFGNFPHKNSLFRQNMDKKIRQFLRKKSLVYKHPKFRRKKIPRL